jgi:hypothetical protein
MCPRCSATLSEPWPTGPIRSDFRDRLPVDESPILGHCPDHDLCIRLEADFRPESLASRVGGKRLQDQPTSRWKTLDEESKDLPPDAAASLLPFDKKLADVNDRLAWIVPRTPFKVRSDSCTAPESRSRYMRRIEETRAFGTRRFRPAPGFSELRPSDMSGPAEQQLCELSRGRGLKRSPVLGVQGEVHAGSCRAEFGPRLFAMCRSAAPRPAGESGALRRE